MKKQNKNQPLVKGQEYAVHIYREGENFSTRRKYQFITHTQNANLWDNLIDPDMDSASGGLSGYLFSRKNGANHGEAPETVSLLFIPDGFLELSGKAGKTLRDKSNYNCERYFQEGDAEYKKLEKILTKNSGKNKNNQQR